MTAAFYVWQVVEDRAKVEEGLRGVLVHAVAGIENGQVSFTFEQPGSAGRVVAEDDGFSSQSLEREARVLEGFTFFDAGGKTGYKGRIGAKAFGGELEAGACARGGLVEEQGDAALEKDAIASERVLILQRSRTLEQMTDRRKIKVHDGEQRAGIIRKR